MKKLLVLLILLVLSFGCTVNLGGTVNQHIFNHDLCNSQSHGHDNQDSYEKNTKIKKGEVK